MPTNYYPFDGDYLSDRTSDYTKIFNDIQAEFSSDFGAYREICATFDNGQHPEWMKKPADPPSIAMSFSNDAGDEWMDHRNYPIPKGWAVDDVATLFEENVYLTCNEFEGPEEAA